MTAFTATWNGPALLRHSRWDALLIALALAQGGLLLALPSAILIALGIWWNSNTVAHNFIHTPFFRARSLNRLFAVYLSVLLGIPQSIWRQRHLAHHAGVRWRPRLSLQLAVELAAVLILWSCLAWAAPWFMLTQYVPAYFVGLALCAMHGYYEHANGTVSHFGRLYNLLFFRDGHHNEHHAHPGRHWTQLGRSAEDAPASRWPAVLRWLDLFSLEGLERLVLRSKSLQHFVLDRHEHAFRRLLPHYASARRVGIIGGGLFPRTILILRKMLPDAKLVVIDANEANLETAQRWLGEGLDCVSEWYDPARHDGFDLLIVPLAYVGDRALFYRNPPAPRILVHDWIWRCRGPGVVVSYWLGKRLNLVLR